ncbi:hypothetical protein ACFLZH_00565 [Patescibacteria group bacterium]
MNGKHEKFGKKPTLASLRRDVLNYTLPKNEKEHIKQLLKNNPEQLFIDIGKYKNKPWAFKFYSKLLTHPKNLFGRITFYAFKHLKKYKDAKWAGKFLLLALKVKRISKKKELYKGMGVANKPLKATLSEKILHLDKFNVFKAIKEFKDIKVDGKPIYQDILLLAVENNPETFLKELPNLQKHIPEALQNKLIKLAVKKDSFGTVFALKKIKDWKLAKKILTEFNNYLSGNLIFFYLFPILNKTPWIKKFFTEVCKKEQLHLAFVYIEKIKKIKGYEEILEYSLNNMKEFNSHEIFEIAKKLKNLKIAEKLFTKAVNKDSLFFFLYFKDFMDKKWAKKLAKIVAKDRPGLAILHMKKYKNIPYLKEIIDIIGKSTHNIRFELFNSKQFFKNINQFITSKSIKDKILARHKEAKSIRDQMIGKKQRSGLPKGFNKYTNYLFYKGKAIQKILRVKEKWLGPPYQKTAFKRAQFRVMVTRNLFYRDMKVSEKNVRKMYLQILKQRAKLAKKPLFKGRSVVYMANNEKAIFRGNLFGRKEVRKHIKQQCGEKNWHFIREESNNVNKLEAAKRKILKLVETKPKLTFVLDGHGSEKAVSLAYGGLEGVTRAKVKTKSKSDHLSYIELAKSLRRRAKRFPNEEPPILILTSCFSSVFIRKLYKRLRKIKVPLPITLGSTEYGQLAKRKYYPWDKIHAGLFKKLKFGKIKTTTFQQVFDNEEEDVNNPTISIPAKDKKQLQIGRKPEMKGVKKDV